MNRIARGAIVAFATPAALPAQAQDLGDGRWGWRHMMWEGTWGWGHMIVGGLMMIVFWVVVIALAVLLVRALSGAGQSRADHRSALAILEERFARGEIDREEFEERRRLLLEGRTDRSVRQ